MSFNEIKLLKDIKNLPLSKLRDIYDNWDYVLKDGNDRKNRKEWEGITIGSLVDILKNTELGLTYLISEKLEKDPGYFFYYEDYDGNLLKKRPVYLIKSSEGYEVFTESGRESKGNACTYRELEEAVFDFLDSYLTELGYSAPDSKINA